MRDYMLSPPGEKPLPADITRAELHALWYAGILFWKLWPQQLQIYNVMRALPTSVDTAVFLCARQYGKSVLATLIAVEDCLQNDDVMVVIIAPKVEQAEAIVRHKMKILCKDAPKGLIHPVKAENTWYFANGSELKLGGYSSGAVSQRGKTLHKVILEEFGPDTDADGYLDFIRSDVAPAMTHSTNAQIIFPTTLPKVPDHPFITETIPAAELAGSFFKFTIDDNEMLTSEQKEKAIKMAGGRDSIECKRELYCEMVRDPQLVVVPSYDEPVHLREFDRPHYHWMHLTGDQGGTRDKTVWLLHTYDFLTDTLLVWDELHWEPNTSTGIIVKAAREKWGADLGRQEATPDGRGWTVKLDAPARQFTDLRNDHSFNATLVDKDDWQANVNAMDVLFKERGKEKRPKVLIHPRCTFLALSCRSGTFNKQRNDFARTTTLGHMDALAALMYAIRAQNRTNPWPETIYNRDHVFKPKAEVSEREKVARAMQPKTFGPSPNGFQPKKFGKFKK